MAKKPIPPKREKALAVRLPPELRQRTRVYAVKTEKRIQDVVAEALEEYLRKRGA